MTLRRCVAAGGGQRVHAVADVGIPQPRRHAVRTPGVVPNQRLQSPRGECDNKRHNLHQRQKTSFGGSYVYRVYLGRLQSNVGPMQPHRHTCSGL